MKALPLILIAGWGHTGEAMLRLKEALDGHPMDGHPIQVTSTGELWQTQSSGALPRAPGLSRYALGLRDLLATFGGRVGIIGWSMGGIVALETAREYPGLLQRLVIISGTARFSAAYYAKVHAPQEAVEKRSRLSQRLRPTFENSSILVGRGVPAEPSFGPATRIQENGHQSREELLHGLDYLQRMDVRNGLEKQTVPTLVVHGREDRIVPWQAGEWLSRALAVSHWRCHAGLGHALPIHAPLLVAADIRAFLGDAA